MKNRPKHPIATLFVLLMSVLAAPVPIQGVASAAQPELDIMLVLDNSGSMKRNDPDFLMRDVAMNFLAGFGDETRLGIVVFDQSVRLADPLTRRTEPENRTRFLKSLETIDYRGLWSDTPAGVERALYELTANGRTGVRKAMVLLTDGIVDTGNPVVDAEKRAWLKSDLTAACTKAGVRIFGIAFTEAADFSLIQSLAGRTQGEYFRAYRAQEIAPVFDRIQAAVTRVEPPMAQTSASGPASKPTLEPPPPTPAPTPEQAKTTPPAVPAQRTDLAPLAVGIGIVALVLALLVWILARRSPRSPAADMPEAELVGIHNVTGRKSFPLNRPVTRIGRDKKNEIPISRDTVSSLHAVIEFRNGSFFLEDQRSRNGTGLNGEPVSPGSPQRLKSGDEITFHTHAFRFILSDMAPAGETVMDFDASKVAPTLSPPTNLPQALLVDVDNITGRKTLKLRGTNNRIGRGAPSELVIPQKSISGVHATVEYRDSRFYLEDQRSKNGTRLNNEPLTPNTPRRLKSGDEITFDVYRFIFMLENQVPSGDTGETWVETE
ncbi:MAG: FHA domain-containing protein [Desulfobacterales bacterium]|nr:FHA domain-containing protein [Desulfobacterales bacterium]